jgi:hypothetical protein
MRTSKNSVPLIPLKDFGPSPFLEHGIFIEAFEDCVSVRHKRMEVHRHDYVELFSLQGYGSVLIDFENYPLSGKSLIAIGPGRVHAWHANKLTGPYIAFTQEFFDGTRPPPSALFDYPFIFGGEVSPVVRLKQKQGEQAQTLFREISQEFHNHENLAVEMIHHQLRLLMVHLARLYAATSPAPFAAIGLLRRFRQALERSFSCFALHRSLGCQSEHRCSTVLGFSGFGTEQLAAADAIIPTKFEQEQKCFSLFQQLISKPVSAMTVSTARLLRPGNRVKSNPHTLIASVTPHA